MADQAINALSTKTAPETSDQLLLVGAGEPQLIDYDKLADAILNKITSKNYALDAGTMTLTAALNALNGKSAISTRIETYNGEATLIPPFSEGVCFLIASAYDAPSNTELTLYILGYHSSYENCRKEKIYGSDFVSEVVFDKSNGTLKFTFTSQVMLCRIMFFRNK